MHHLGFHYPDSFKFQHERKEHRVIIYIHMRHVIHDEPPEHQSLNFPSSHLGGVVWAAGVKPTALTSRQNIHKSTPAKKSDIIFASCHLRQTGSSFLNEKTCCFSFSFMVVKQEYLGVGLLFGQKRSFYRHFTN